MKWKGIKTKHQTIKEIQTELSISWFVVLKTSEFNTKRTQINLQPRKANTRHEQLSFCAVCVCCC